MTATVAPFPKHMYFDNNGLPAASHKLFVYTAGTSTKTTTWSDSAQSSSNTNPIVLDSSGRFTCFLAAGTSVKFVLAPPTDSDPPVAPLWTVDSVQAVPTTITGTNTDITGTAGETLAAGDCVYLAGATQAGFTAGRWYKTDADSLYQSVGADKIGIATTAITSGSSGTIRTDGQFSNYTAGHFTDVGVPLYVSSTAGALAFAGSNTSNRLVGIPDSDTSIVLIPTTAVGVNIYRRCSADLTKNNSAAFSDVTGLSIPVGVTQRWAFQFYIFGVSNATADWKFTLTGPTAPTTIDFGLTSSGGVPPAASYVNALGSAVTAQGSVTDEMLVLSGLLYNGVNNGTLQLQMAQNTANVSNTVVYDNSYMIATRLPD